MYHNTYSDDVSTVGWSSSGESVESVVVGRLRGDGLFDFRLFSAISEYKVVTNTPANYNFGLPILMIARKRWHNNLKFDSVEWVSDLVWK